MSTNIKDILNTSICAFCETIHRYESLAEDEFLNSLKSFLLENDLDHYLSEYTYKVAYDTEDINNICRDIKFKRRTFEFNEIINCCRAAYIDTLNVDKTINVGTFVDNLIGEFMKK